MTNSVNQSAENTMLTVQDLGLRAFNFDKKTNELKSVTSEKCPVATSIPVDQFMLSKEPGRRSRAVPYSGHQIMNGIQSYVKQIAGIDANFGQVFIYRDTMSHPGYVSKITPETRTNQILRPETPISELVFERFIGTMDLINNDEASARIALKFEEDKLELALGTNITICQNFNIFGGKRIVTQRGLTYEGLIENVQDWLGDLESHFQRDLATIAELSRKQITKPQVHQYIGEMMELYQENKIVLPVTDITALTAKIVQKQQINTLWDLTQAGTEVIRFDSSAGNSTLEVIEKWNNFTLAKL